MIEKQWKLKWYSSLNKCSVIRVEAIKLGFVCWNRKLAPEMMQQYDTFSLRLLFYMAFENCELIFELSAFFLFFVLNSFSKVGCISVNITKCQEYYEKNLYPILVLWAFHILTKFYDIVQHKTNCSLVFCFANLFTFFRQK